jgi:hypothetical protein
MSDAAFNVSFDEIQQYDWQQVPGSLRDRDSKYEQASTYFFQKGSALREAGDDTGERVFRFLGAVMSLFPNFDSKDAPFRPEFIDGTRRSAALEDFTSADSAVLAQLVPVTKDPEIKARFADVAALVKFDHTLVQQASAAYLAAAGERENCGNWVRFISDVERAAQLGWKLGRKSQAFTDVMLYVNALIEKFSPTDTGLCCSRLLEIMQEFGHGDAVEHAKISEILAERAERNQKPHFALSYWKLAADWHQRATQERDSHRCAIRAAETHVLDAEAALERKPPSYVASAGHLAIAVDALRRANAPKARIEEVHRLLLDRQKSTKDEMGSFSTDMDITHLREGARNFVKDQDFRTAIIRLATGLSPIDPEEQRASVEKMAKDHPLTYLMSASAVDREGRVVGHRPSLLTTDPIQYEAALWAEMMHQASTMTWPFRVQAFIEPARWQIWHDHRPRVRDLHFLVVDHPFVPPGHAHSFARGFHAGFEDDWHSVAYFLAPQVENCLRYVLENRGIITSKLDHKLIQEVRSLDKLLLMPETTEAIGADHVFELRGILTEEFGSNLRHRIAHGLITDNDCYAPATEHLWWLLLRLCVLPILAMRHAANPSPAGQQSGNEPP